ASTTPFQWIRTKDETNLSELGITGELVYQGCPVNQSFEYSVANFISSEYSDSIVTNSLHALGTVIGFSNLDDVLAKAIQRVDSTSGSTYTYFHWPIIDKYAHEVGTDGEKTLEVVLEFDRKMQQLRGLLPDDATLVITADHGHLNYPEGHRIQVQQSDPIRELLFDAPSGDERAAIFHVNDGSEEEFEQTFNERFGDRFLLLRRSEVIEQKLLGPDSLSDVTSGRLGQFMAISKGSWAFSFRDGPSRAGFELRSQHGGLTPDEMLVPVIIA
ncbi:MAG: alkaline phosphatase family protein, partial [Chloroflexota bacterium]